MADIVAIGGYFGSANSYGGVSWGVIEQQVLYNSVLVVDNCTHGHTVDSVTVTQQHTLAVDNALHNHTADNVTINQQHTLVVNNTTHGVTSDTPWLIYNVTLAVDNTLHSHTVDNVTLTQQHLLAVANAAHSLTSDLVTITQQHSIVVNDTTHGLLIDGGLTLNQFLLMNKPDDSRHGLSFGNIVLTGNQVLAVDNLRHILYLDEPGIVNWEALDVYFGRFKPDGSDLGSLTPSELAILGRLYSNLLIKNGSFPAVEVELGIHKKEYGKTGQLLEAALLSGILKPDSSGNGSLELATTDSGLVKQNTTESGILLADRKPRVLMFQDGFAWLSEDGMFGIIEEAGNTDKIDRVSEYGVLKQGNIEYGKL